MTRSTTLRNALKIAIPPAFWLGVWQLASMAVGKEFLLPAPAVVFRALGNLALTALFWQTSLFTLGRIFAGLLAGGLLGALLAVLTGAFSWAGLLLSPAVRVVRATPVASFILLLYVWVKSGAVPGVVSALMVLPVIWGNVSKGIAETDPLLLELGRAYRFSAKKRLRLIYVPSVFPYFISGCNTAMGLAWKAGVAAEVLCQPRMAVGSRVYAAKLSLDAPALFAWTLVVIAMSLLLERVMGALFRSLERGARA